MSDRRKVREIHSDIYFIMRCIEDNEGEITEADETALAELDVELEDKIDAILSYAAGVSGHADTLKTEVQRLQARIKVLNNTAERLKKHVQFAMTSVDKQEIETRHYKVWRRFNNPALVVYDEDSIPKDYWKESYSIDKAALKQDILDGKELPGARVERGEHIRVK